MAHEAFNGDFPLSHRRVQTLARSRYRGLPLALCGLVYFPEFMLELVAVRKDRAAR